MKDPWTSVGVGAERMAVEGGWLYRTWLRKRAGEDIMRNPIYERDGASVQVTFVPAPPSVPAKEGEGR